MAKRSPAFRNSTESARRTTKNGDERLRDLERAAGEGDHADVASFARELERTGLLVNGKHDLRPSMQSKILSTLMSLANAGGREDVLLYLQAAQAFPSATPAGLHGLSLVAATAATLIADRNQDPEAVYLVMNNKVGSGFPGVWRSHLDPMLDAIQEECERAGVEVVRRRDRSAGRRRLEAAERVYRDKIRTQEPFSMATIDRETGWRTGYDVFSLLRTVFLSDDDGFNGSVVVRVTFRPDSTEIANVSVDSAEWDGR